jgi:hypothetical protein
VVTVTLKTGKSICSPVISRHLRSLFVCEIENAWDFYSRLTEIRKFEMCLELSALKTTVNSLKFPVISKIESFTK